MPRPCAHLCLSWARDDNDEISDDELRQHCPSMADLLLDAFQDAFRRGVRKDIVAETIVDVITRNHTHLAVAELLSSQTFDFAWTQRARPEGDGAHPGGDHIHPFFALATAEQEQRVSEMLLANIVRCWRTNS